MARRESPWHDSTCCPTSFFNECLDSMIGDLFFFDYFLPALTTSIEYRIFLQQMQTNILHTMSEHVRRPMCFQHGRVPPLYGACAREHLNQAFGHRFLRSGPVPCYTMLSGFKLYRFLYFKFTVNFCVCYA